MNILKTCFLSQGTITAIRFAYPIIAQVEAKARHPSDDRPLITCIARERTEQRLELVLTGATPAILPAARLRQVTPSGMRGISKVIDIRSSNNLNVDPSSKLASN